MKAFYPHALVAVICFSLMGPCPGGQAFCLTPHNNAKMSNTAHKAHGHGASAHSYLPSGHECHCADSSQQCCQTPSKNPAVCTQSFVLPNNTNTVGGPLGATLSAQIAINCFQFSGRNFISGISNAINPTLSSLGTVVLLL